VEGTVSTELISRLAIQAGGQWMNAVQHAPSSSIDGLRPENTPTFTGNASIAYRFHSFLEGLRLSAGAQYTGLREINPLNQGSIPAVTIFTCGAGYARSLGGHRLTVNLNVTNLTNKRYWSSASNNNLGVGIQRSFRLNATFEY